MAEVGLLPERLPNQCKVARFSRKTHRAISYPFTANRTSLSKIHNPNNRTEDLLSTGL